ncbi:hypothetical protein V2J09_009326 [Rumex salicifolius]
MGSSIYTSPTLLLLGLEAVVRISIVWPVDRPPTNALSVLRRKLITWNKSVFGDISVRKEKLLQRLEKIQIDLNNNPTTALFELDLQVHNELNLTMEQEEELWLQAGDRNNSFFHLSALIRRRRNKVLTLLNDVGVWIDDPGELENLAVNYFRNLYQLPREEISIIAIGHGQFPTFPTDR